jgi:hypothetical protein
MVSAILDDEDRLFRASDPPGRSWAPNRDRYSGFVRQVSGQRVEAEKRILARIRAHHRIAAGRPVRLFPRDIDAMLLGGLRRTIDTRYARSAAIRAHYALSGGIVRVSGIAVDDRPIPGSIPLRPACGNASRPPPSQWNDPMEGAPGDDRTASVNCFAGFPRDETRGRAANREP